MLRRRWGFQPLAAADEDGIGDQGSAEAVSTDGRLHGLRALYPCLPPLLAPLPACALLLLLALLAIAFCLARTSRPGSFHTVTPHAPPGHEHFNKTSSIPPLLPSARKQAENSRTGRYGFAQGLKRSVPSLCAKVRCEDASSEAVSSLKRFPIIDDGMKGSTGASEVRMHTGMGPGDGNVGQLPARTADAQDVGGNQRAPFRATTVPGLPALITATSSAPGRGSRATAEVSQGCWLHPGVPEAAQKEAMDRIWGQLSVLDAKAAAAEAAEVALGPTEAQKLLEDMLAAEAAEREVRAGVPPTIPGAPWRRAFEGSSTGGVDGKAPDPVCGVGSLMGPSPFRAAVSGRHLLLVMHEASLTGAPLALAELAAQARACGAQAVQLVLLNWQTKGVAARGAPGAAQRRLLKWLRAQGVHVLKGKGSSSYAAANASDVVILGSATCARWLSA